MRRDWWQSLSRIGPETHAGATGFGEDVREGEVRPVAQTRAPGCWNADWRAENWQGCPGRFSEWSGTEWRRSEMNCRQERRIWRFAAEGQRLGMRELGSDNNEVLGAT